MKETVTLATIIGGGQTIGTLESGKKALVWGGIPGETVEINITKKKSSYVEGIVSRVITPSPHRVEPKDPESYLSTSPWQIMSFEAEQKYKQQLIYEAFKLHHLELPSDLEMYSDENTYGYRNKVEFSFWYDTDNKTLRLAFFRRGTHGKLAVEGTSLAMPAINAAAVAITDILNRHQIGGRQLKTLLIRCNQAEIVSWQLYVKDEDFPAELIRSEIVSAGLQKGEIIFSNPKSPASVITRRLCSSSDVSLSDTIRGVDFRYATEGFFQINIPLYENVLNDIAEWVDPQIDIVDLYSGVGTIGLTIGAGDAQTTLVEINQHAVREMQRNIEILQKENYAQAVLAASEDALHYITNDQTLIVDPPRAGLHVDVINRILEVLPKRVLYLSCNPVTQARDIRQLSAAYTIKHSKGYNFFPRTPHIEQLIILDLQDS